VLVEIADGEVHAHYGEAYYESAQSEADDRHGYASYHAGQASMAKGFATRVALIRQFVPSGRLFEAGAAYGFFLKAAEPYFVGTGIEVSGYAAEVARTRYQADVRQGNIEQTDSEPNRFDVVVMWDVIEHLIRPVPALKEVRRILKPGGFLFVSTDDASNWLPRLLARRWWALAPPLHLCHFSKQALRAACALAGLDAPAFFSDPRYYTVPEVVTHFGESYRSARLKAIGTRLENTRLGAIPLRVSRPEQFVAVIRKSS
jgi:SAM-dependent methyltransferase